MLVSWCNGSIVDFESIDGGSIPPETVNLRRANLFVGTVEIRSKFTLFTGVHAENTLWWEDC